MLYVNPRSPQHLVTVKSSDADQSVGHQPHRGHVVGGHRGYVETLGHPRAPLAGYRPDHRAGVELAAIDAHRTAEAAADLEGRLDDGVAREARPDRFEIRDFAGRARRAIRFLLVRSGGCARG